MKGGENMKYYICSNGLTETKEITEQEYRELYNSHSHVGYGISNDMEYAYTKLSNGITIKRTQI